MARVPTRRFQIPSLLRSLRYFHPTRVPNESWGIPVGECGASHDKIPAFAGMTVGGGDDAGWM